MALNATSLASAIKSAVDSIDITSGEKANDEIIQALATGIVNHITANAQVIVAGGSSSGVYGVV